MPTQSLGLFVVALACSSLGLMGIAWSRCSPKPTRAHWGRRLFLLTLAALAGASLVTAYRPDRGLLYVGLAVGALVIVMVWESPRPRPTHAWLPDEA